MDYIIYIDDYLIEDNPVRVMDAFVDSMDMVRLNFENAKPSDTGRLGFDSRILINYFSMALLFIRVEYPM